MQHINQLNSLPKSINQVTQKALDQHNIVGSVVMVSKHDQIIYQQASGYANWQQKKAMNIDALFLLSSVSKPIVTAAALRLVEQGVLDLQAPVTDYLPSFTPKLANGQQPCITLHHLLTHTAGLSYRCFEPHGKGVYNTLHISDGFDDIFISLEENMRRLVRAPLSYQPGTYWAYSLSIDVLGAVMMAATHQSLDNVVKTVITEPLDMGSTGFAVKNASDLVTHYYDAKPYPLPMPDTYQMQLPDSWNNSVICYAPKRIYDPIAYHSAGAGMVGSAPDFMQFILALTQPNNQLSANALIQTMAKCYVSSEQQTKGPGWGFGYGGAVLDDPHLAETPQGKGTIQWGGVYGHTWFYDPINDLAVVILTNTALEGMSGRYPIDIRNTVYATL